VSARLVPPEVQEAIDRQSARFGRYVTVQELGRGGMGVVFKAWDSDLGRWVALKVMLAGKLVDAADRERFLREARVSAQFNHANIAPVYEVGVEGDQLFLAMQFIDGRTLAQEGGLAPRRAAEIVRDAAYALQHAHDRHVVHRDVKPANLMIAANGHVFVLDFGLARAVDVKSSISATGLVVGTPAYMSPEQARGEAADGRSDVYSLGATLYHALTGRPPFDGTVMSVLEGVVRDEPVAPSKRNLKVPRELEAIVLKAMAKRADARYAAARELGDDLQRFILGEPVRARPPSIVARAAHAAARHPTVVVAAALVLAAGASFGAMAAVQARRQRELREQKAQRERIDAEVALLGQRIESWAVRLHDPPHPLAGPQRELEAMLAELAAYDTKTAWRFRGRALGLLRRYEEAEAAYGRAEAWEERGRIRLHQYGRGYRSRHNFTDPEWRRRAEARELTLLSGAVEDFGRAPEGAMRLAVLERKDVWRDAVERAERTADADAWDLAAEAAYATGRNDDHIAAAERAARIRESDVELVIKAGFARLNRVNRDHKRAGTMASMLEDLRLAERHFESALVLVPDDREVMCFQGEIAMHHFWAWFGTRDIAALGGVDALVERMERGLAQATKAFDLGEKFAANTAVRLLLRIGMVLVENGRDPTAAIERQQREVDRLAREAGLVTDEATDRAYAFVVLAQWEIRKSAPDGSKLAAWAAACEQASQRLEECEGRYYYPALVRYYAGAVRRDASDLQRAIELCTEAVRAQPGHAMALKFRGLARLQLGKWDEAIADLEACRDPAMRPYIEEARKRRGE
jgi:tRNA A-37 threonylcarbamoyl transferase component Bud32/tetratricopeptide (TPR) repeat protein